MFDDPQLYIFALIISASIYWVIPWKSPRLSFLLGISMLLVMIFYPQVLPVALLMTLVTWYGGNLLAKEKLKNVWIVIGALVAIFVASRLVSQNTNLIVDTGLTFLLLKSTGAVFESSKRKVVHKLKDVMLLNFLFPIFPSGPIELSSTVNEKQFADSIQFKQVGEALYRVVFGLFRAVFFVDIFLFGYMQSILSSGAIEDLSTGDSWLYTYLKFLSVYLNFSGVIDIVIGTGLLFGIRFAENFNFPLIATNIQNFWKRWHMSLGRWINRYLFNILVRNTGKVGLSLMITFGLVGAWHAFSINYVIWGVLHGVGLTFIYKLGKKTPEWYKPIRAAVPYNVFACVFTVTFVAVLSTFANTSSFSQGLAYAGNLIGL